MSNSNDDTDQGRLSLSRREALIGAGGWMGGIAAAGLGIGVTAVDFGGSDSDPSEEDDGDEGESGDTGDFDPDSPPLESVVEDLQAGGYVLYIRHEQTQGGTDQWKEVDMSPEEISEFAYDDPVLQRNLSLQGWRRAERVGNALDDLGIPIGTVLSSPIHRCRKSAELTVGTVETTHDLNYTRSDVGERAPELLTQVPDAGTNTALFAHSLSSMGLAEPLEGVSLSEGTILVLDPERELTETPVRLIQPGRLLEYASG